MKKLTVSKDSQTKNRSSNGFGSNSESSTNSLEINGAERINGHDAILNGISLDDNTEILQSVSDEEETSSSSVVVEMVAVVDSANAESVGVLDINGADDNEMETVSYDANVTQEKEENCCASCSSSLSNHSQGADFLDIDLDAEPDQDEEDDYFDFNRRNSANAPFERNGNANDVAAENNLSQNNEQLCQSYSPPVCVTPQLNDMMEQLPGPSSFCRGVDEPEDEGIICQDGAPMPVTSCSTDCEVCFRTDLQLIGVLPPRLESDFGAGAGTSSSSYRRRGSQFFCVGGPLGKQYAEETFIKNSSATGVPTAAASSSTENDSWFNMSIDDAKKLTMQIGPSACGATSVSNVLSVLKWNHVNLEQISYVVSTRTRAVGSPLAEYLLSRSVAGVSHLDLMSAMENLTWKQIKGRFFHMYPKRRVNISQWLLKWLKRGAVPVLTANVQRGNMRGQPVADAWHHQMVIGASSTCAFLTNPVESITENVLQDILCSPSVLLVRTEDVHQHWTKGCDLGSLMNHADSRWTEMNVIGQILCVIREFSVGRNRGEPTVTHIAIPACYLSGVTLFAYANSAVWAEIVDSQELPMADLAIELEQNLLPSSMKIF